MLTLINIYKCIYLLYLQCIHHEHVSICMLVYHHPKRAFCRYASSMAPEDASTGLSNKTSLPSAQSPEGKIHSFGNLMSVIRAICVAISALLCYYDVRRSAPQTFYAPMPIHHQAATIPKTITLIHVCRCQKLQ